MLITKLVVIDLRPEIGQGGFQRALGGDIPLVGSERLDEARIDVVVGRTPEETDSGVLERPDVPIPGAGAKALTIPLPSDVKWRRRYLFLAPFSTPAVILYGNESSVRFNLDLWWRTRGTGASTCSSDEGLPELEEVNTRPDSLE